MALDIAALESSLDWWAFAGYCATGIVALGCIGESIVEFTSWVPAHKHSKAGMAWALVLIFGLACEVITQVKVNTISGQIIAFLNNQTAQLETDLQKEREKTSARPWTKEQFDAIQEIKGSVTDVGILWASHCSDCQILALSIEMALVSAGVQIYGSHAASEDLSGSGVFVKLPVGSDLGTHPLVIALRKAGLYPGGAMHHIPEFSKIRTDIPVIFVGDRFAPMLAVPYQPPGLTKWTTLPIEK
jgi:hypothetical protein